MQKAKYSVFVLKDFILNIIRFVVVSTLVVLWYYTEKLKINNNKTYIIQPKTQNNTSTLDSYLTCM